MDVLREFGFLPNDGQDHGFDDSLVYDFGNFKLDANLGLNRQFRNVVHFWGNWSTGRTIGLIEFELPCEVDSRELCAALIAYNLDGAPADAGWLIEGRQNQDLLPWTVKSAAYEARPHCTVGRDWLRLALKTLADQLAVVGDNAPIIFGFDGGVFSMQCGEKMIALPGEGVAWPQQFTLPAGKLRHLPKRLMSEQISVSVWDSHLWIDRWRFSGVEDVTGSSHHQRTQ